MSITGSRPGGRTAKVTAEVHAATLQLLQEKGYDQLQLPDVAELAGVNKTTVYRRWKTKAALVGEILSQQIQINVPPPDTGSLFSDLRALLTNITASLSDPAIRAALQASLALGDFHKDVNETRALFWQQRFKISGVIVENAVQRGEIPSGTNSDLLLEMASSPIYFRTLLTDEPIDDTFISEVARRVTFAFAQPPENQL